MRAIGLIGLGLLGSAIAQRLLAAGFHVIGYDLQDERRAWLAQQQGCAADSSAAVAAAADVIVLSLPDSDTVARVLRNSPHSLAGKLLVDTTTGDPEATDELADWLAQQGAAYVDATVVGSSQVVREGRAVVLLGGEPSDVERACEVVGQFAREWFYVGPCGSGATAKLVVNLVLGLHRAVLAEGLHLASRCGLDRRRMLDILRSGAAYSAVMDSKGNKMLSGDFTAEARLSQHHKDVQLILTLGRRVGASLPLSQLHDVLLARAEQLGLADQDNSAIVRVWETPE